MVRLTVHVRPKNGYAGPNKIKTVSCDSSRRLEDVIVADLRLDTSKGIALFAARGRRELALNSSLATNNIRSGDILETCSCPRLSAVLSAVLEDLNAVQRLPHGERTRDRIEPLLGLSATTTTTTTTVGGDNNNKTTLDPWPDRWNHDSLKSRIICLAMLKKVIQRHDRFAQLVVPPCHDLPELYAFLREHVPADRRSSTAHIFKPANKDGKPTTCWQLLQFKLDKMASAGAAATTTTTTGAHHCNIERFLVAEHERHATRTTEAVHYSSPTAASGRKKPPPSDNNGTARNRRRLAIESPSARLGNREWKCTTCKVAVAVCMCLTMPCPFHKHPSCHSCFSANHPILHRDHERIPLTDARAKAVLKAFHRQDRHSMYCPEYASGPFSVLCTLYDQAINYNQLSLSESPLKELAQPMCRSNLYDHQARGRNAFACMEGLMERNLVRMERVPGTTTEQDGKYSLLPEGEALAKYCFEFQEELKGIVHQNPNVLRCKREALGFNNNSIKNSISIVVDTREDRTYAERLLRRCQQKRIAAEKRELPAGDYIFTAGDKVCPIVLERKSWSDLADSVLGKGQRRLDCVRLDGNGRSSCGNGRCQLCKMKASGCSKIMFIVEGARCANLDSTPNKCTEAKRCQFCREIQQRHGRSIVQETLEDVLYKLQADHGCFVHYTRSYNESIDSLLIMREILGAGIVEETPAGSSGSGAGNGIVGHNRIVRGKNPATTTSQIAAQKLLPTLTYEQFCSNTRRRSNEDEMNTNHFRDRGKLEELDDSRLIRSIFHGTIGAYCASLCKGTATGTADRAGHNVISPEIIDLNESSTKASVDKDLATSGSEDSEVQILDNKSNAKPDNRMGHNISPEVIDLYESFKASVDEEGFESESADSEVQILDNSSAKLPPARKKLFNDSTVIEIDSDNDEDKRFDDSQDFVQIIDNPTRTSGGTTARKKRRRPILNEDDEIEVLAMNPEVEEALGGGRMRKSEVPRGAPSSSLLLIYGLYENDMEMHKDISEIWKGLYHQNKASDSAVGNSFRSSAKSELQKIQETQAPFVDRNSLLFWLLYIQLSCNIRINTMRQKNCRQRLESRRRNSHRCTIIPPPPVARAQNETRPMSAKRPRLSSSSPQQQQPPVIHDCIIPQQPPAIHNCILCTESLEARDWEKTPCGHSFHSDCLQTWLSSRSSGNRRCPTCKYVLETFKTDDSRRTTQKPTPKAPPSAALSSVAQQLREARLARFDRGNNNPSKRAGPRIRREQPDISPVVAAITECDEIREGWDCATCTYRNRLQDQRCEACDTGRPHPHTLGWSCGTCTLRNNLDATECSACGTPNPGGLCVQSSKNPTVIVGSRTTDSFCYDIDGHFLDAPYNFQSDKVASISKRSSTNAQKCGACGNFGHNRASATPDNCPKYYDDEEVKRRAKKKEQNNLKALRAREQIDEIEKNSVERNAQLREAQRALASLEQSVAADESMRQNEVKRLKKARARAEKQARKYD